MLRLDADRAVEFCDGLRRRDFLHAGSLSALGLSLNSLFGLKALGAVDGKKDVNCIMLMLVGGPSQLDTWDMKPNAPAEIRVRINPLKPTFRASRSRRTFRAWPSTRTSTRLFAACITRQPPYMTRGTR